jgi:hypothetical protein
MDFQDQIEVEHPKFGAKKIFWLAVLVLIILIASFAIFLKIKIDSALSKNTALQTRLDSG